MSDAEDVSALQLLERYAERRDLGPRALEMAKEAVEVSGGVWGGALEMAKEAVEVSRGGGGRVRWRWPRRQCR